MSRRENFLRSAVAQAGGKFGTYVFGQRGEGSVRAGQSPQQCDGGGAEHQRRLHQLAQRRQERPELQRHRFLHRILLVVGLRGVACAAGTMHRKDLNPRQRTRRETHCTSPHRALA